MNTFCKDGVLYTNNNDLKELVESPENNDQKKIIELLEAVGFEKPKKPNGVKETKETSTNEKEIKDALYVACFAVVLNTKCDSVENVQEFINTAFEHCLGNVKDNGEEEKALILKLLFDIVIEGSVQLKDGLQDIDG